MQQDKDLGNRCKNKLATRRNVRSPIFSLEMASGVTDLFNVIIQYIMFLSENTQTDTEIFLEHILFIFDV